MTSAAADPSWWADWPKFAPGWLAFLIGLWTLFDKWRTRRHRLALGPDDDALRARLATLRGLFKEIQEEPKREEWFKAEGRRDLGEALHDLSWRRTDRELFSHVSKAALSWTGARIHAPGAQSPFVWLGEVTPEDRAEEAREQEEFRKQREAAQQGLAAIQAALKRMSHLERHTVGRP